MYNVPFQQFHNKCHSQFAHLKHKFHELLTINDISDTDQKALLPRVYLVGFFFPSLSLSVGAADREAPGVGGVFFLLFSRRAKIYLGNMCCIQKLGMKLSLVYTQATGCQDSHDQTLGTLCVGHRTGRRGRYLR